MIVPYDRKDWVWYGLEGEGERSCLIEVVDVSTLELEVRSSAPVVVNFISSDGLTLPVSQGSQVSVHAKLTGFSGVEIVGSTSFCYRSNGLTSNQEKVDSRSMTVIADESVKRPTEELVKAELLKYVARYEANNVLASDVSVEELLDDIESGDLEFDAEPDMFGLGYEERLAEWASREPERDARDDGLQDPGKQASTGSDEPVPATPVVVAPVSSAGVNK